MLIRASYVRMILAFAILPLSASAGAAQVTSRPQSQVTPEQLREAQTALSEATEVAGRAPDPAVIAEFVQLWFRMDRTSAPEAVEGVYSQLRAGATEAQTLADYQKFTNSAYALLSSYVSINPQRVAALLPGWPDPALVLGQAAQDWYAQAKSRFNSIIAPNLAAGAPRQALNMLGDSSAGGTVDYSANGRMLMKLNMSGQKEEALKLADDTVAAFSRQELTNDAINRYRSFLGQLARIDVDRYMRAMGQLLPMLSTLTNPRAGGMLTVGEKTLELTAPEAVLVSIAVNLSFNSGLAAKTLDLMPGLKRKTDSIGLIDEVLNRHPEGPYNLTYSFDGVSGGGGGTMPQGGPGSEKYLGLHGRPPGVAPRGQPMPSPALRSQPAPSTPASVPVTAEMQKMDQELMLLIGQAKKAGESDPAQAAQILLKAADLVKQFEPLTRRAISMQDVMGAYRDILGRPSPELIKEGFALLWALAEQEKRLPSRPGMVALGSINRSTGSRAIDVEASLVCDLAMYNFDEATRYVRSMPEDERMICFVRIAQTLSGY